MGSAQRPIFQAIAVGISGQTGCAADKDDRPSFVSLAGLRSDKRDSFRTGSGVQTFTLPHDKDQAVRSFLTDQSI